MIQSPTVRALAHTLVLAVAVMVAKAAGAAADSGTVAVYWQPPGQPAPGTSARPAFADATRALGARFVDATTPVAPPPSLVPPQEAIKAAYARFAFAEAVAACDDLQRQAELRGGGDLSTRQLSEIFLYRGLARLELGPAEAAWDDLVRAAHLDPGRLVDPARFPPRAVGAFKRAVAEVATLPRAELTLVVPAGAVVRLDGALVAGTVPLTLGPHFASVTADGFEPWAAVVPVTGVSQRLSPPLRAYQPPDGDALLAASGNDGAQRVILGALERTSAGWRFVVRDMVLPDGKVVSAFASLADAPVALAVHGVVDRLTRTPPPESNGNGRWRWRPWAIGGAAVLLVAASVSLVLASRDTSSPNVAGDLGPWR